MKVIFLDIDGVLNGRRSFSPLFPCEPLVCGLEQKKIDRLRTIVQKTGARLVLSSTWRIEFDSNMIPSSSIGQALSDLFQSNEIPLYSRTSSQSISSRAYEVQEWLDEHPNVSSFLIIDDNDFGWGNLLPRWLRINPAIGLTQKDAKIAIRMLME